MGASIKLTSSDGMLLLECPLRILIMVLVAEARIRCDLPLKMETSVENIEGTRISEVETFEPCDLEFPENQCSL